jgi:LysR family transcriptional regulator, regulator for bpeEF and oprC
MIENVASIVVFVRVAETLSFTSAARQLAISGPAASKAIARLERRMGARLFHRTTRRVALTDDGQAFLERCRRILEDVQEAEEVLTSRRLTLRGRLRVQMPLGFGRHVILPSLPELLVSYPELAVDVDLSDRVVDFTHEGLDLAVRIGPISDSRVIAKKLYDIRFVTCASPGYLKRKGTPSEPEDLAGHECLPYWMPPLGRHREWMFERGGAPFTLPLSGRLNINNSEALIDAAVAGQGIVSVATFLAADAVKAGRLKVILREFVTKGPTVSAVYLPTRHLSTRIRAFLDFLAAVVPEEPAWDRAVLGSGGAGAPRRRAAGR